MLVFLSWLLPPFEFCCDDRYALGAVVCVDEVARAVSVGYEPPLGGVAFVANPLATLVCMRPSDRGHILWRHLRLGVPLTAEHAPSFLVCRLVASRANRNGYAIGAFSECLHRLCREVRFALVVWKTLTLDATFKFLVAYKVVSLAAMSFHRVSFHSLTSVQFS